MEIVGHCCSGVWAVLCVVIGSIGVGLFILSVSPFVGVVDEVGWVASFWANVGDGHCV